MLIQSKKIWIADQFMAAELDIRDGKIVDVLTYGSRSADVDYEDLRIVPGFWISTVMEPMALTRTTPMKKVCGTGQNMWWMKA